MKTFKVLSTEVDEVLGFSARKAVARRMKMMAKKASTKFKKARNKMKALSQDKAKQKAQKAVRTLIKQKTVGKSKDLKSMSIGQKAALEKKVDKKVKNMGGRVHALVKKFQKKIVKQHRANQKIARTNRNK